MEFPPVERPPVTVFFMCVYMHKHIHIVMAWLGFANEDLDNSAHAQHNRRVFCFRYHTGSLAFGALILAVVQLIRVILEYLDHKLKGEVYESAPGYLLIWQIISLLPQVVLPAMKRD